MITLFGLLMLMVPAALMALAIVDPGMIQAAQLSMAAVLGLMLVDHLLSRTAARVEMSRSFATHASGEKLSVGAANAVHIAVRNLSVFSLRLVVKDDPPQDFSTPHRAQRIWLRPHASGEVSYQTTPRERGDFEFGDIHVRGLTALGLTWWQRSFPAKHQVAVYPNLADVSRYEQLSRAGKLTTAGFRPIRGLGTGTEFESLREYVPDDELRSIDWKATARRHQPITRQYEAERSQSLMLLIDSGRMMAGTAGRMSKLDYAINAALMLSYVAVRRDDRVGVLAFADTVEQFVPARKDHGQVGRIADALYALPVHLHEPDYALAFSTLFSRSRKRSLVVCFTDLIDTDASARLLSGMASLYPRHLPLLIAIEDPDLRVAAAQYPETETDAYEKAMAIQAIEDRRHALSTLSRSGVLVMDSTPQELTVATVNRYLEIKDRHML